ncbi:Procollagen C-endopeptidase enhancer 1 [Lamellibrachia satsuma]|nr:Procollagen C-endopeptidase enhancer 1 [Lamellibrachia satsuma]
MVVQIWSYISRIVKLFWSNLNPVQISNISYAKASLLLQRVQLHFVSFDLEANSDCVSINDNRNRWINNYNYGMSRNEQLLGTFCGGSLPGDVTSSGNTLSVNFKTVHGATGSGFSIYYTAFSPVDGCFDSPAEMRGNMGTFGISDNQTFNYMTCSWKIQVETSKLVQLHFLSFDLVASTDCRTASVKIYDGNDTSAPLVHSFCGDSLPGDVTSSGNTILVHFMHFKHNSYNTYDGFTIYYSVFTPVEAVFERQSKSTRRCISNARNQGLSTKHVKTGLGGLRGGNHQLVQRAERRQQRFVESKVPRRDTKDVMVIHSSGFISSRLDLVLQLDSVGPGRERVRSTMRNSSSI